MGFSSFFNFIEVRRENHEVFSLVDESPLLANKNQVREDEKLGMVLCVIIHDERALTLFIFSNLGRGFKATLLPKLHQDGVACRHPAFDKVFLSLCNALCRTYEIPRSSL